MKEGNLKDYAEGGSLLREVDEVLRQFDLIDNVLSFLEAKELLFFAMASKWNAQMLTYERVFQSIFEMSGGKAPENWTRLVALVERRQIWTPSPLRMLCLALRRTCERCYANNAVVCGHVGVVYCTDCFYRATDASWDPGSIVSLSPFNFRLVLGWAERTVDAFGNRIGPLATRDETKAIGKHLKPGVTHADALEEYLNELRSQDPFAQQADSLISTFERVQKVAETHVRLKRLPEGVCVTVATRNDREAVFKRFLSDDKKELLVEMLDTHEEVIVELENTGMVQLRKHDRVRVTGGHDTDKFGKTGELVCIDGREGIVVNDDRSEIVFFHVPLVNLVKIKDAQQQQRPGAEEEGD